MPETCKRRGDIRNHPTKASGARPSPPTRSGPAGSPASVSAELLDWYDRHGRVLPWRARLGETPDPYAVWLSEIMLQQTTVGAVKPFYAKFLAIWPTVEALAAASLDDVLRAWAGLGYYSRARNLHACARAVVDRHGGRFPDTEVALRQLPGVGAYTAAAIAAIGFGRDATVVDGNVERVMARLFAIDVPFPKAKPLAYAAMAGVTPSGRAGDFAQAVMDLGATLCTPKSPACAICPVRAFCVAAREGQQTRYPLRLPKRDNPVRYGTAYYVENATGEVLVRSRPAKGLLGGMTELPGTAWTPEPPADAGVSPNNGRLAGRVKHVFTHFTLMLDVVVCDALPDDISQDGLEPCWWVPTIVLRQEALPTLMHNAIDMAQKKPVPIPPTQVLESRKRRRS